MFIKWNRKRYRIKLRDKSRLRSRRIRTILRLYKNRITRLRPKKDTKRRNMTSRRGILKNRNTG